MDSITRFVFYYHSFLILNFILNIIVRHMLHTRIEMKLIVSSRFIRNISFHMFLLPQINMERLSLQDKSQWIE